MEGGLEWEVRAPCGEEGMAVAAGHRWSVNGIKEESLWEG